MIKKIMSSLLFVILLFSSVSAQILYEDVTVTDVTRGVTHTYIERLNDGSWDKINVITADLSDENVELVTLYDKKGISYKSKLSTMSKDSGAVAAINADFFDTSTPAGRTTPLGLTIKDGNIVSSASHDSSILAAFVESTEGVTAGYFHTSVYVHTDDGNKTKIYHINKYHSTDVIVMFTRDFGLNTPENNDKSIEMIVENNKVVEFVSRSEGSPIPENGYVLKVNPTVNNFLTENFKIGDNIEISVEISPDFGEIKNAVGGGTVLVEEGKVAKFTHKVAGNHPRTAAGISQDSKTLYLVVVEGRETNTPGMTLDQLANFMISIGAYSAINFDGGGSSQMTIKNKIVNTPSDGSERAIPTGLGVKSVGKNPYFDSMTLSSSKDYVFVGDYVEILTKTYNNYKNIIETGDNILFSADDGGKFINNRYYPQKSGKRTVTATLDGISAKIEIDVLPEIANLTFSPSTFSGENGSLSLIAADENGFKSQISPDSITWKIKDGNGSVSNGNIVAKGIVTVSATFGDKTIQTKINAPETKEILYDKFKTTIEEPDFVIVPPHLPETTLLNLVTNEKITEAVKQAPLAYSFLGATEGAENIANLSETTVENTKILTLRNEYSVKEASYSWQRFLNLENISEKNICIYLTGGNTFKDDAAKRMFDKTLIKLYNQGKNVFVISYGESNDLHVTNGVRYITIKKTEISLSDFNKTYENSIYLKFKISGENLTYDIAQIWK